MKIISTFVFTIMFIYFAINQSFVADFAFERVGELTDLWTLLKTAGRLK